MADTHVTVSQVFRRLGVTDPAGKHKDDARIQEAIEAAELDFEEHSGLRLSIETKTQRFDGNGKDQLFLPFTPVTDVVELKVGTAAISVGTADDWYDGTVSAYFDDVSIYYPAKFPRVRHCVRVSWTIGWAIGSLPKNYQTLLAALAAIRYKERDRFGEKQKNMKDFSLIYTRNLQEPDATTWRNSQRLEQFFASRGVDV